MYEYNMSILQPPNNTTTHHDVLLQVNVIVTSLSSFAFLSMSMLLVYHHRGEGDKHGFNHHNHLILLFFGIISATITPLSVARTNEGIYSSYLMAILGFIGIVLYVAGCTLFFEISDTEHPLCYKHPDVSLILWVVAIPLVLLELFETISALKSSRIDMYFVGVRAVGLVQKLVQAGFYHFNLRLKVVRANRKKGAGWFLITMSLFNYAMWLDSIITANDGTKYIVLIFGKGFSIVATACMALLIDYRLLCCLMFAEHALDIQEEAKQSIPEAKVEQQQQQQQQQFVTNGDDIVSLSSITSNTTEFTAMKTNSFIARATQMSGFGYSFGFTCLTLQLVCGLQYAKLVGHWTNLFPIFADASVICLGAWFIYSTANSCEDAGDNKWRETHSKAIDIMVAIMGVIGFLFWFIKTGLNLTWSTKTNDFTSDNLNYLNWSAAKNSVRTLGILFHLYMFMKSDPLVGCRDEVRDNTWNFFLLPSLMLSLLSVFIMTIIDSYSGFIEVLVEESNLDVVLTTLFKAGEPIHLGFCLHIFLHFFIINTNMRNFKKSKEIQRLTQRSRSSGRPTNRCANNSIYLNTEQSYSSDDDKVVTQRLLEEYEH